MSGAARRVARMRLATCRLPSTLLAPAVTDLSQRVARSEARLLAEERQSDVYLAREAEGCPIRECSGIEGGCNVHF